MPDAYKLDNNQSLEDVKTYIADDVGAILIGYGPDDKVKSILWYNQATIDGLEATINEDESELVKESSIQEESTNNDNSLETSISESNGEYWVYLEAGNYDYDVMFIRDDIRFSEIHDIDGVVADMIEHMSE